MWICVDGTEGVGKSALTPRLATLVGALVAPEFSGAHFGRALATAVRSSPHLISSSPVGQSLAFIADFYEVHAAEVAPHLESGTSVVSDRGYLSKYAYQEVVLTDAVGRRPARELLDGVFAHLTRPDLTIHLVASPEVLRERLVARDGNCTDDRLAFMARTVRASEGHLRRTSSLHAVTVDANRPVDVVVSEAVALVRDFLTATRHR